MPKTIQIATRPTWQTKGARARYRVRPSCKVPDESVNNVQSKAVSLVQVALESQQIKGPGVNLLGSSVQTRVSRPERALLPSRNGFLDAVIKAYNGHHHLTISPDDVWIAILAQFNIYVNANAEALRAHFVSHSGQKDVEVSSCPGSNRASTTAFAQDMAKAIQAQLVDPEFSDWILPNFTTTTPNDTIVCTILMMSTLKTYFTYSSYADCGIPSITLEGEKSDWESILARTDKLPSFGAETTLWATLLRPILRRFVEAFDVQEFSEDDMSFWDRICDYRSGSGYKHISGWIGAFAVWNDSGRWVGGDPNRTAWARALSLDGVVYPEDISVGLLPKGYGEAELTVRNDLEATKMRLVGGHLAHEASGDAMEHIRPYAAWVLLQVDE